MSGDMNLPFRPGDILDKCRVTIIITIITTSFSLVCSRFFFFSFFSSLFVCSFFFFFLLVFSLCSRCFVFFEAISVPRRCVFVVIVCIYVFPVFLLVVLVLWFGSGAFQAILGSGQETWRMRFRKNGESCERLHCGDN